MGKLGHCGLIALGGLRSRGGCANLVSHEDTKAQRSREEIPGEAGFNIIRSLRNSANARIMLKPCFAANCFSSSLCLRVFVRAKNISPEPPSIYASSQQRTRVAASISSCCIKLSPTKNVRTPNAFAIRWQSAWVEIPLSHTSKTSCGGAIAANRSVLARSTSNVFRLRLLTPINLEWSRDKARVPSRPRHAPRPAHPAPRPSPHPRFRPSPASSNAATIIRIASAPIARASAHCHGSTMKSLRMTGSSHAPRAATR